MLSIYRQENSEAVSLYHCHRHTIHFNRLRNANVGYDIIFVQNWRAFPCRNIIFNKIDNLHDLILHHGAFAFVIETVLLMNRLVNETK